MSVDTDEAVIDDLYNLGFKLGIKPLDIKNAIDRASDKRELLRGWKGDYATKARGVLIAHGRLWAKENAAKSVERHGELRDQHAASRRAARKEMSLGRRVDALMAETILEPGPGVAALGSTKIKGGESDGMPPDAAEWATDFDVHIKPGTTFRTHWLILNDYIERLEGDWDKCLGRDEAKNWLTATQEEKDREIINHYMGVTSVDVARINPNLGDRKKVEDVRRSRKLNPVTGEPR